MGEIIAVGIPSRFGLTGSKTAYKDENILLGDAEALNFTGAGVTATLNAGVLTVEVDGGSGSSINVVDNLASTSATDALSAAQGNALDSRLSSIEGTQSSYGDIVSYNASSFVSTTDLTTQLSTKADLVEGKVPASQLPSYVDDVLEYADLAAFPVTGATGKLYIAIDTNLVYRWTGSVYAVTSTSLALGEAINTAYRGDRGKIAYDHSQVTGNPHGVTKGDVGLGNVDNTSDADKPISTATALALGDIPAIATTNGNSNNGTRTTITGGKLNTVTGTDNSITNSSNNTVSGTGNTITGGGSNTVSSVATCTGNTLINCLALRLGTTSVGNIADCTFIDVKNNYTTPEAPLNFNQPQNQCTFTGWLNNGVVNITWPKGYSIKGQKRKILGAFGFSGSAYISHIDAVVELAAVSSTGSSQLKVQKDPTKAPVASNIGFYQDGFTEYTLTFQGYNPTANQRVTGTRVLRESNGVITDVTPPSMVSTVTNGFNLGLSVSVAPQSGYYGLIINVQNLASTFETQWVATLESKIVNVSIVP